VVGGGGKTSALFSLGQAASLAGRSCALTTTTHIYDPRAEAGRWFGRRHIVPELAQTGPLDMEPWRPLTAERPAVFASALIGPGTMAGAVGGADHPRLNGILPDRVTQLAELYDLVVVEADGSRGLPIKAPATHEPVVPGSCVLLLACIGLDCLGRLNTDQAVHRPGLVAARTGCAQGSPLRPEHLARLAAHPEGLFKACPSTARRVLLLNKADLVDPSVARECAALVAAVGSALVIVAGRRERPFDMILEAG